MKNLKTIYLDYAAATPMDPTVLDTMHPYFSEHFYNPSATYLAAKKVSQDIETARASVASWLGARSGEIVFTAGGSEANNLAINGVMRTNPSSNIVTSVVEHESVLKPAEQYKHKVVKVLPSGTVDLEDLQKKIDDNTALVSIMYANNEIGTIEPIAKIAKLLTEVKRERIKRGKKTPLYFHTDACQAANYLDLHVSRLGVDLMSLNGGKIYGPKQSGILYVKTGTNIEAQIVGGGQEHGLRSGTQNVASIIGFAKALDLAQAKRKAEGKRVAGLQKLFIDSLITQIPGVIINGPTKNRLPNNVHITIVGEDNERLIFALDEMDIQAASGSACSASSEEPSHVLKAIGLSDKDAKSSLRFSMGQQTTALDIKHVVRAIKDLV